MVSAVSDIATIVSRVISDGANASSVNDVNETNQKLVVNQSTKNSLHVSEVDSQSRCRETLRQKSNTKAKNAVHWKRVFRLNCDGEGTSWQRSISRAMRHPPRQRT